MIQQRNITSRIWAELFLLALIWGGVFLAVRISLDEVPFITSVAHRVFWAALLLWGYVLIRGLPVPKDARTWVALFVMGCLNNVIPFSLMAWGQLYIETGLTSILNAATAIFGVVLAAVLFADERLTTNRLVGVIIGFLGVAIAIGIGELAQFNLRSLAQLAVLGGTISYAFAGVWARKSFKGLPPQIAAAGMLTGSTAIMIPLAIAMEGRPILALQTDTLIAIGYYAIIATAVAYLLYYRVLTMAGSGNLMLCTLLVAPVAIILGVVVLGEELKPQAYFGFAVLALGLLILDGRILSVFRK